MIFILKKKDSSRVTQFSRASALDLWICLMGLFILALVPLPVRAQEVVFPKDVQIVNVKKFGAKGDGRTDDTQSIRAAIAHLDMNLTLYFPDGDYLIRDTLDFSGRGDHGQEINRIFMQGQSRDRTIIRLAEKSADYQDAGKPKPVITTKRGNESFRNRFNNFSIIVGKRNPGAIGIDFISCNGGSISQVRLVSEDQQQPAAAGVFIGHGDNGPCLIQDVEIVGFRKGFHLESWFWSNIVAENLILRGQSECGVLHESSVLSLVGLKSDEPKNVPAVVNRSVMSLVDAELKSAGGKAAVINEAKLFARNVKSRGYQATVASGDEVVNGDIYERVWGPVKELFPSSGKSINLAREIVPEVPWDTDISKWVNVENFGAKPGQECADGIQAAIDHAAAKGLHTVYFPRSARYIIGKTVRVHGSVQRITGFGGQLAATKELSVWLNDAGTGGRLPTDDEFREPILRIEAGSPVVMIERMEINGYQWGNTAYVEHAAPNTVVFRYGSGMTYRNTVPGGKVFLDDWTGQLLLKGKQNAQVNVYEQVAFRNDGGTLLMLGLRNESCSTIGTNLNGAATEILSGLTCAHHRPWVRPSFLNVDARLSIAAYATGHPGFAVDERHGYRRELLSGEFGRDISLFVADPLENQPPPAKPVEFKAANLAGKWPFKIQLDWSMAPKAGETIVGYELLRNGKRVTWTDKTTWIDEVMLDNENCNYEVRTMNGATAISESAKVTIMTPADDSELTVTSVVAYPQGVGGRVHLTFNKPISEESLSTGTLKMTPNVEMKGGRLEKDLRTVTVESGKMTTGSKYVVEVGGIRDLSKNPHVLARCQIDVPVSNDPHGLMMEVFSNKQLNGSSQWRRTDQIDQDWEDQPPLPGLQPGNLSIRWTGRLRMDRSNTYQFVRQGKGQSTLWIDGKPADTASLVAGRLYDLRVEYVPAGKETQMRLLWQTPDQPEYQALAPSFLYLPKDLPLRVESAQSVNDKLYVVFNQPVDTGAAGKLEHYQMSGGSFDTPIVSSDGRTVTFFARGLTAGREYTLRAIGLTAKDGGPLASDAASSTFTALGAGTGLNAYFMGLWEKSRDKTRVAPDINFDWGLESPFKGVPIDYFRVEWEGWLVPPVTGEYTFSGVTDDWDQMIPRVDGVTLFTIKNWRERRSPDTHGNIWLNAGQPVRLHVFFRDQYQTEKGGKARCEFFWEANGLPKEIVPTKSLYPSLKNDNK